MLAVRYSGTGLPTCSIAYGQRKSFKCGGDVRYRSRQGKVRRPARGTTTLWRTGDKCLDGEPNLLVCTEKYYCTSDALVDQFLVVWFLMTAHTIDQSGTRIPNNLNAICTGICCYPPQHLQLQGRATGCAARSPVITQHIENFFLLIRKEHFFGLKTHRNSSWLVDGRSPRYQPGTDIFKSPRIRKRS